MEKIADWSDARGEKWVKHVDRMEAMLQPVDEPLIDALDLDGASRIADIGCGGGGTTLEVLRRARAGSVVHGHDISPASIEFARSLRSSNDGAVAFEVTNIESASLPQERYDRLLSRFGTMFFRDQSTAFANLHGWLTPGGRFAFAVWGPQKENLWEASVRAVVAEIVDVPQSGDDEPGPFRYADAGNLVALLRRAGFENLEVRDWRAKLSIGGGLAAEDAADFALAAFSSFGELLAKAGTQAQSDARKLLAERLQQFEEAGAVRLDARVHIVTGARAA